MSVANRVRPDIHQMSTVFSTKVKEHNDNDWKILVWMIKYLNDTNKNYPTLSSDDLKLIKWCVDASFAVSPDFKSHAGAIMNMG